MAWLTVRVGSKERGHEIDEDILFIGSAEDAAIRIKGEGIADKHCQVLRTGGAYKVVDLGGPAGVMVNGEKVSQYDLNDGDVVELGAFTVMFQDEAAAAAPAPTAPATAPAPQRSRAPTGRGGGSRRSEPTTSRSGGRRSAKAAARNAVRARNAEGGAGQPLVRKRLRESRGMPAPALYALIAVSLIASASIIYWFMTRETVNIEGYLTEFHQAVSAGDTDRAALLITQAKAMIDESHTHWDMVNQKYNEYANLKKNLELMEETSAENSVFLHNVKPFYEKYIDISANDLDFEKYEQYLDDPTTARYFVQYRLDVYLGRWPNGPNAAQVRAWKSQLEARYNPADPFPAKWWDVEVISAFEEKLEHYGESYRVLTGFLAANPDHKHRTEVEEKIGLNYDRGKIYWEGYCLSSRLQPALEATEPNYAGAWRWALKGWANLKGIPEFETAIRRKAEEIRDLADADGWILDMGDFE